MHILCKKSYPCTAWPQEVGLRQGADACLFMKIDGHATVMSDGHPALGQNLKRIVTPLCKNRAYPSTPCHTNTTNLLIVIFCYFLV